MVQTRASTVIGVFADPAQARQARLALAEAGFTPEKIKLAPAGWVPGAQDLPVGLQRQAQGGALAGVLAGAAIGGFASALGASLALGDIWSIGSNPFFSFAAGAAFGMAAGAFLGPFLAMALGPAPTGQVALLVEASERQQDACDLLRRHGAYDESMKGDPEVPLPPQPNGESGR